jgi:hypothetical protein
MPTAALDAGTIMILVVLAALPIGALAFALGAGNALKQIGKGPFSIEQEMPRRGGGPAPVSPQVREEEVRQMVEARSYRRQAKGGEPIDVDAEVERLLASEKGAIGADPALRAEVRQLVIARNERRARRGEKELDVESEVERQLAELENLGQ